MSFPPASVGMPLDHGHRLCRKDMSGFKSNDDRIFCVQRCVWSGKISLWKIVVGVAEAVLMSATTKLMAMVQRHANDAGGKLILVGDDISPVFHVAAYSGA